MEKQTLIDPIPCFMSLWTTAINLAHQKKLTDTIDYEEAGNLINKDFTDHDSCLVGEIHDFNDKYSNINRCSICVTSSIAEAGNAISKGGDTLILFKIKMYNHMIDEHRLKGKKIKKSDIPKINKRC